MARTQATFKQTDVTRAIRAVESAGVNVACIEITIDGAIRIYRESELKSLTAANDFDRFESEL